ncbi:MAG: 5-deoxy-glucuronate isomerase [Firmicutes bacterium]|nr:5-deoxy-glucuronate isomerase [Bacillota bacterium]
MLQIRPVEQNDPSRAVVGAGPAQTALLRYVSAEVYRLSPGVEWRRRVGPAQESAVVVLTGEVTVREPERVASSVGRRRSVFESVLPYVLYLPSGREVHLTALTEAEVVWAQAELPEPSTLPPRLWGPEEMTSEQRGEGVTAREVRHLLEEPGQAMRLRLVEVVTPAGHWSSFPPHKHDEDVPGRESLLEELYYYHLSPPSGWALQRVYDGQGWGEVMAVGDGDLVMVPRGYHPFAVPPGYTAYYLNIMAGTTRDWRFTVDPAFRHVPSFHVPERTSRHD